MTRNLRKSAIATVATVALGAGAFFAGTAPASAYVGTTVGYGATKVECDHKMNVAIRDIYENRRMVINNPSCSFDSHSGYWKYSIEHMFRTKAS